MLIVVGQLAPSSRGEVACLSPRLASEALLLGTASAKVVCVERGVVPDELRHIRIVSRIEERWFLPGFVEWGVAAGSPGPVMVLHDGLESCAGARLSGPRRPQPVFISRVATNEWAVDYHVDGRLLSGLTVGPAPSSTKVRAVCVSLCSSRLQASCLASTNSQVAHMRPKWVEALGKIIHLMSVKHSRASGQMWLLKS